jgi:hypothetical protein
MMAISLGALFFGLPSRHVAAQGPDPAPTISPAPTIPRIFDASVSRDEQIALAMSAAPAPVSSNATVYVLGPKGYEKARQGTNGFSCLVYRSFVNPTETTVGPMCFDAEGSRTTLVVYLHSEELRSSGKSEAEIKADAENGYKAGRFEYPSKMGLLYMMSNENRLGPTSDHKTQHYPPHLMFYAPNMTAQDLGFDSGPQPAYMGLSNPGKPNNLLVVLPTTAPTQTSSADNSGKN